jgi:GT2 family glycosyltransferase
MSPSKGDSNQAGPETPDFRPVRVLQIELSESLPDVAAVDAVSGRRYGRAWALVRLHSTPVGLVEFQLQGDGLTPAQAAEWVWDHLGAEIAEHLRRDGLPPVPALPTSGLVVPAVEGLPLCLRERAERLSAASFASVIVATHNRPESLAATLDSLLAMDYPHFEIIVVDNAPSTGATADLIAQQYSARGVRYTREDEPGLGRAHNRGLPEVRGSIVAFTDDDVLVDRHWLAEMVHGFDAADQVGAVTGMIFPAELETPAQVWIEEYGGFSKGLDLRVFDLKEHRPPSPLYPYTAGWFGSGASMAFRTSVLREMGGFDPSLGAGTLAMGGDDLASFFEVVHRGYRLVYQPAAILRHWHRREYAGLRRQAYGYGVGLTAYLTSLLLNHPGLVLDIALRAPYGLAYVFSSRSPKNAKKRADYPTELDVQERRGMRYGPVAYLRSRRRSRHVWDAVRSARTSGPIAAVDHA